MAETVKKAEDALKGVKKTGKVHLLGQQFKIPNNGNAGEAGVITEA